MKNTPEVLKAIDDRVVDALVDRAWAYIESQLDSVILFPTIRVAAMLQVSEDTVNRYAQEYVDLGERNKRLSLEQIKKIIKQRTVTK